MIRSLLSCCCPSEDDSYDGEGNERTHLIRNGGGYGSNRWTGAPYGASGAAGGGGGDQRNGPAGPPADDDEQAILARILHDTANSVIDISTTDTHTVEPREYMERARKYNQQLSSQITAATLQQATSGSAHHPAGSSVGKRASGSSSVGHAAASSGGAGAGAVGSSNQCLLADTLLTSTASGAAGSSTDKVLSSAPVTVDDLLTIRQLTSQIGRVVTDIHVEHKEDLVVQFAPS